MDLRDFLTAIATRNGATNPKHYHGYAAHIRRDFPRIPHSETTAAAVASRLGHSFPTWDELREAIRETIADQPGGPDLDDDARMAALWSGYYRRRVREAPSRKAHLLSLLRAYSPAAFAEIDDGSIDDAASRFDRDFWEARGGHRSHNPEDYLRPALRPVHVPTKKSGAAPAPSPPRPRPAPLPDAMLADLRRQFEVPDATR